MKTYAGKLAVVTGAGSGMGRELVCQLAAAGADVAMCDVSEENMAETLVLTAAASATSRVSSHICDVADEVGIPIEASCFIGSSPIRQYAEDWDLDTMLSHTEKAVTFAVGRSLPVMFVTEDTTRATPETVRRLYTTAIEAGAFCAVERGGGTSRAQRRLLARSSCSRPQPSGSSSSARQTAPPAHSSFWRRSRLVSVRL